MGIGIISSFGATARCYFQVKKISMGCITNFSVEGCPEPVIGWRGVEGRFGLMSKTN